MGQVSGKVAVVTGGASGIGEACAETLAREGASVLITDIDDALGKGVVERITKAGGKAHYQRHDVRDETAWPGIIADAEKRFGRLDIMVANAGIGVMAPIETMTLADWQRQQAINLDGVFLSIKHSIPAMRRAGGGSIVLMSSIAGLRGAPGLAAYSATKGGVRLLAKSVALEHAADNIRCNSVHPGIIATPIWGKIPTGAEGNRRNAPIDPKERAAIAVPLTRVGEAQDIANGVLFLCTEAANYMTGQELVIDGGMTAGGRAPPRPQQWRFEQRGRQRLDRGGGGKCRRLGRGRRLCRPWPGSFQRSGPQGARLAADRQPVPDGPCPGDAGRRGLVGEARWQAGRCRASPVPVGQHSISRRALQPRLWRPAMVRRRCTDRRPGADCRLGELGARGIGQIRSATRLIFLTVVSAMLFLPTGR